MRKIKIIDHKKGFTVIELLIALTILLIVIVLGYSFNFYVTRSFDIATKQSEVQQNVRLAKNMIENYYQVRFSEIKLLNAVEEPEEDYQIIYVDDNGIIKYQKYGDEPKDLLLADLNSGINMQLTFTKDAYNDSLLGIKVAGDIDGDYSYYIDSKILIENATAIQGNSGSVILFKNSE